MARYPGAAWKPLGSQTEPRMSRHAILCYHTMVGSLRGTDTYFRGQGFYGVESHFGVGHATDGDLDGAVWQWQDTAFCADANLDGKPEVVSIETSDGGDPNRPWSPKQIDALVELGVWVCKTHSIPPRLINGNQPGSTGIAYHRQGCDHSSSYRPRGWPYDQWRVPNGVRWSSALGKTCPGDVRIKQLVDVVIPRIKAGVEGDDMPSAKEIAEAVWGYPLDQWDGPGDKKTTDRMHAGQQLNQARGFARAGYGRVGGRTRTIIDLVRKVLGKDESVDVAALADELAPRLNAASAKALSDEIARRMQS